MVFDNPLARLLEHPAIWRGRSSVQPATIASGFVALDAALPGGGWPLVGLVEILTPQFGIGELRLLVPVLAQLTQRPPPRWVTWVAPPFEPYAPALAARGLVLERQLVVHTDTVLWAMEQALGSGACDVALGWTQRAPARSLRRLQLAAERGRTLGVLFRALRTAREASPAMLRLAVEPLCMSQGEGVRITLLKSRGGARGSFDIHWTPR